MAALAVVGLLNYTDDVAMAAATGGLVCTSTDPCTVVVPMEGRVLSLGTGGTLRRIGVDGGPLHVVCPSGAPPIDFDGVSGSVSVRGCRVGLCDGVSGDLTVDWDGHASCTNFHGTVTSTGSSSGTFSGNGLLNSGGDGPTTILGGPWTIRGTGPVNFSHANIFEFDHGTAGIESVDWSWLDRPAVTISAFANEMPVTNFKDQTIEVLGGWPDGSTLTNCIASGSFGHVPVISKSSLHVSDDAFGPIVERIERSIVNGNIRSEGSRDRPVLLNEVDGTLCVATETTFANSVPRNAGSLSIEGPHCVLCPDCGWTEIYDGSPVAETDVFVPFGVLPSNNSLDLQGHWAVLDLPPDHRLRRRGLSTNGTSTTVDGETFYYYGTVSIVGTDGLATISSSTIFKFVDLILTGTTLQLDGASIEIESSKIYGDGFYGTYPLNQNNHNKSAIIQTSSASHLTVKSSEFYDFMFISVSQVILIQCKVDHIGSIGVSDRYIGNAPTAWCVCDLRYSADDSLAPFVYDHLDGTVGNSIIEGTYYGQGPCDSFCVYTGQAPTDCSSGTMVNATSPSSCPATTTTTTPATTTTTTTPATTTTSPAPTETPYVSSGSVSDDSSRDDALVIISGVAVGGIFILTIAVIVQECRRE